MANTESSKGNPAAKRMSNPARKARRAISWRRAQQRHQANRQAQEQREKDNRTELASWASRGFRADGRPSKALRTIRREWARMEARQGGAA